MTRVPEYDRGYIDARRDVISYTLARAKMMNDPKARDILNSHAKALEDELVRARERRKGGEPARHPNRRPAGDAH